MKIPDSERKILFGPAEVLGTSNYGDFLNYPKIASEICNIRAEKNKHDKDEDSALSKTTRELKEAIANCITAYSDPNKSALEKYQEAFDALQFAWVITTNYDSAVESLIRWESTYAIVGEYVYKS
ncbi:hypothetical protein KIM372_14060 [Bombiscardovia nodaiensis]|uniref:Uncharacterized protein n=1 Tax=Bombiscardovia nodaiensis TaxID=2932181 RepID=A0ABM8B9C7_9BIFI|nr:hypothetical protein KIM372_14060 [Bombiscardovia nodaiensis]